MWIRAFGKKNLIEQAIEDGLVGFRNGWISSKHISDLTGLKSTDISKNIKKLGYHRIGPICKMRNGERAQITVYNLNPDANPDDFWKDNGYDV